LYPFPLYRITIYIISTYDIFVNPFFKKIKNYFGDENLPDRSMESLKNVNKKTDRRTCRLSVCN